MKILIYSETRNHSLLANLGAPEYSYFFVLKAFLPALRRIGDVQVIDEPALEVDPIFHDCRSRGEPCVFLTFSPPHRTLTTLECPTVPVFAWEFDDIPCESWGSDGQSNWQQVLAALPGVIVHSGQTADAVRRAMGDTYPIGIIPAPIWSRIGTGVANANKEDEALVFEGRLFDSRRSDWTRVGRCLHWERKTDKVWLVARAPAPSPVWQGAPTSTAPIQRTSRVAIIKKHLRAFYDEVLADFVPAWLEGIDRNAAGSRPDNSLAEAASPESREAPPPTLPATVADLVPSGVQQLSLDGVVYCTVLNPEDGRKNVKDMLSAFCEAFRECEDATLLIKLTHAKPERALSRMIAEVYRSTPFACRIVLLAGYLDDDSYQRLIALTSYVVNTSHGEGQCLPLMEFMSAGKPAIAPDSSAMADYITTENAFVVASSREMTCWPQDPRQAYRTYRYRIDFESLVHAFKTSYSIRMDAQRYENMSRCAQNTLREHCSDEVVAERFMAFLNTSGLVSNRTVNEKACLFARAPLGAGP